MLLARYDKLMSLSPHVPYVGFRRMRQPVVSLLQT
jgi:hypothetical protein